MSSMESELMFFDLVLQFSLLVIFVVFVNVEENLLSGNHF